MNEYTYLVMTRTIEAEMEERAARGRLVAAARQAAKERRAAEREIRRLEFAIGERRPGPVRTLLNRMVSGGSVAGADSRSSGRAAAQGRQQTPQTTEAIPAAHAAAIRAELREDSPCSC